MFNRQALSFREGTKWALPVTYIDHINGVITNPYKWPKKKVTGV